MTISVHTLLKMHYFGTHLIEDARVRAHIHDLYKDRPDVLNRLTATQWLVPETAEILPNRVGSAPLMIFHKEDKLLACMPGVPYEMKIAMEEQILPYIGRTTATILHKTLQVTGIAESSLAILLEDFENMMPDTLHLAYLPKDGIIRLRLSSYGELTEKEIEHYFEELKQLVRDYLIAETDEPIEVIVGNLLKARHQTIATAESCTGGKLASLLNKHAGSSAFYFGSIISYDNSVKEHLLNVPSEMIKTHGVVSEEVVCEMANNVRKQIGADFAIATSGIAGPSGGSKEKPVGTVWIAWATPNGTTAECFHLGKLREQITDRACTKATIVMTIGLWLGEKKIKNFSLGVTWVLFVGIALASLGVNIDHSVAQFAKDFGLILFVYSIGLQVGPSFSPFKRGVLHLNMLAASIVLLACVCTIILHYITGIDMSTLAGVMSGATTSTPSLAWHLN